jgi:hypothetical protein
VLSTVAPLNAVIIVGLPHYRFPVWMMVEQAVIVVLLLTVAIVVGRGPVHQGDSTAGQQVQ